MNTLKKILNILVCIGIFVCTAAFTPDDFSLADLQHYRREYESSSIGACTTSSTKTYEDYRLITARGSAGYQYIHNRMTVDPVTGLLYDEDGFIGVAMGTLFGAIGSRYYVVLSTGIVLPVVKVDEKAAADAPNGCTTAAGDAIEFVLNTELARNYFGGVNGYVANGNLNNSSQLRGSIVDFERVSNVRIQLENTDVTYMDELSDILKTDEETTGSIPWFGGF